MASCPSKGQQWPPGHTGKLQVYCSKLQQRLLWWLPTTLGFEHDVETKVNTGGGGGGAAMFTFVSTPKANFGAALCFQYRPMGTPSHLIVDSLRGPDSDFL